MFLNYLDEEELLLLVTWRLYEKGAGEKVPEQNPSKTSSFKKS